MSVEVRGADAAISLVAGALRQRPSAVFSDIDGTISPIVDVPQDAVVLPRCRDALRRLTRVVDLVCLLTGRPADEAWRMVGVDEAVYVGNHGVETWLRGELLRPAGADRHYAALGRSAALLRVALAHVPGLVFEDKGIGFAIHYRRAAERARDVVAAARRIAGRRGLRVFERTLHVEVRAPVAGDKGTALGELAARYGARGVVVLGDDAVDTPAFDAARAYAERGGARVALVSVGSRAAEADVRLDGPPDVGRLLTEVAAELGA